MSGKNETRLIGKRDLTRIAILAAIALVIGVYLIATTVLIAKDGVFYIERAQQLASDPIRIIKAHPPGYPFLILVAHKCAVLFADDSSVFTWIYAAQSVTLLCRLLALIPLYFIGKLLVGGKNSFWALLILIFLPFPTKIVCDVVREWPYLLFLAAGFFFLLWGAKSGKWWLFGFVGLSSGLGYLIRHESAQLVVYGFLWVAMGMFRPKLWGVSRWKNLLALALLVIGFAIPVVPYMKCAGRIAPPQIKSVTKFFSVNALPDKTDVPKVNTDNSDYNTAGIVPRNVLKALGEIFKAIGESLMWFFMPALVIGLYYRFRGNAKREELFLVTAFVTMNVAMMILRYCYFLPHVSQRWNLPLITFTVFYIPVGLRSIGNWLESKFPMNRQKTDIPKETRLSWFVILFLIGTGICMPKLFRPVRIEKQGYKDAAKWLRENTAPTDIIAVPDRRISFYAEREGMVYTQKIPGGVDYAVKIYKGDGKLAAEKKLSGAKKIFSCKYDNPDTLAVIYDVRGYVSEKVCFVEYHYEKIADEKYKFSFVFDVNNGFEKNWRISFHGYVREEHIPLLPEKRKKHKFDNWDFNPKPATSDWPPNGRVIITRDISAKPIPYDLRLGFYSNKDGKHGRKIRLGWVDMGNVK